MKSLKLLLLAVALTAFAGVVSAQEANLSSGSNSVANTNTASNAANEGVNTVFNSYGADKLNYSGHFSQTVKGQVPISVAGYGSFSQASCMTSAGGGITSRIVSFVYNGPTADINCQHVVMGDAFGRATQLAKQLGVNDMARSSLSMTFYAYCTGSKDFTEACKQMRLVVDTGKKQDDPSVAKHWWKSAPQVAVVVPAAILPDGAEEAVVGTDGPAPVIPSRPAGWSNVAKGPQTVSQAEGPKYIIQQDAFSGSGVGDAGATVRMTRSN